MINLLETIPGASLRSVNTRNLNIFNTFAESLQCPIRLMDNGDIIVKATVTYYARQSMYRDTVILRLICHGYDAGDIHIISNSPVLNEQDFHLVFKSDFGTYTSGKTRDVLIIENRSTKMGGDYRVELEEKRNGISNS